jgi:gluconokinase
MASLAVAVDIGSSSVRSRLFNDRGEDLEGFGLQVAHSPRFTDDGGVEIDADALAGICFQVVDHLHQRLQRAALSPQAVGISAFWHSVMGVDAEGRAATPIYHLFDTRAAPQAEELKKTLNAGLIHQETGCMLHASYWPAKLLWLSRNRPEEFRRVKRWVSFGEFLFGKIAGRERSSVSMVSGSGLWDQLQCRYHEGVLAALPVERDQLAPEEELDEPITELNAEFRARWPRLHGIPWFPALGDGACNNMGTACVSPDCWALMVGTSGAMRVVCDRHTTPPPGLWLYRVDRKRFISGGALSNGGEVYAWMRRMLALPPPEQIEAELARRAPGSHGLTLLPFFAGERSPYWRADLRGVVAGLGLSTEPMDLMQAALESVSLRFREIFQLLEGVLPRPSEVIASGAALRHSPAWVQMMADALDTPVTLSGVKEASSRGAALLALERIGAVGRISDLESPRRGTVHPRPEFRDAFRELHQAQQKLFGQVFG